MSDRIETATAMSGVPNAVYLALPEDYGCCALDDAAGSGHDGPCARICDHCQGTGHCPACDGTGDDGSGLDYTCMECGGGACPYCDEGLVYEDV